MQRVFGILALSIALLFALAPAASAQGVSLESELLGSNEVGDPPGDPDGFGTARMSADVAAGELCFELATANIGDVVAAHIHIGGAGSNGDVVVNLDWEANGAAGCVPASSPTLTAITTNPSLYYVNVHTADLPAGAIRGQLAPSTNALPAELAFTGPGLTSIFALVGTAMLGVGALLVRAEGRTR